MENYYVSVELRYSEVIIYDDETETRQVNKVLQSDLFNDKMSAVNFANKLIIDNLWLEQYPGYVGQRMNNRGLLMFSLRNGTQIFIKVEKISCSTFDEMNNFLTTHK